MTGPSCLTTRVVLRDGQNVSQQEGPESDLAWLCVANALQWTTVYLVHTRPTHSERSIPLGRFVVSPLQLKHFVHRSTPILPFKSYHDAMLNKLVPIGAHSQREHHLLHLNLVSVERASERKFRTTIPRSSLAGLELPGTDISPVQGRDFSGQMPPIRTTKYELRRNT